MPYVFILAFAIVLRATANEPTFIQQVNIHWRAKEYPQILQKATQAAAQQPPKTEAFAVLFGYYLYIDLNHTKAIQAINNLLAAIEHSNPKGFQAITEYKLQILQFPPGEARQLTTEQIQKIHELFPEEFPVKDLIFLIN